MSKKVNVVCGISNLFHHNYSVYSPYNESFIKDAKKNGGKWDAQAKAWIFDDKHKDKLKEILYKNYGYIWH